MKALLLALTLAATALSGAAQAKSWDWQLTGKPKAPGNISAFNTDPDKVKRKFIKALNKKGVFTICYISVGTWEDWRSDADQFPEEILGETLGDWPDERYVDLRRHDILLPIMQARFEKCKAKGFKAIEPDNMDGFENNNGFLLSPQDTIDYMKALADIAHGMGMKIGQKNAPELVPALSNTLDFAILESCFKYGFCREFERPHGYKNIYAVEYTTSKSKQTKYCKKSKKIKGVKLIFKHWDLDKWRKVCK